MTSGCCEQRESVSGESVVVLWKVDAWLSVLVSELETDQPRVSPSRGGANLLFECAKASLLATGWRTSKKAAARLRALYGAGCHSL